MTLKPDPKKYKYRKSNYLFGDDKDLMARFDNAIHVDLISREPRNEIHFNCKICSHASWQGIDKNINSNDFLIKVKHNCRIMEQGIIQKVTWFIVLDKFFVYVSTKGFHLIKDENGKN